MSKAKSVDKSEVVIRNEKINKTKCEIYRVEIAIYKIEIESLKMNFKIKFRINEIKFMNKIKSKNIKNRKYELIIEKIYKIRYALIVAQEDCESNFKDLEENRLSNAVVEKSYDQVAIRKSYRKCNES